jgi:hypothetical protein
MGHNDHLFQVFLGYHATSYSVSLQAVWKDHPKLLNVSEFLQFIGITVLFAAILLVRRME